MTETLFYTRRIDLTHRHNAPQKETWTFCFCGSATKKVSVRRGCRQTNMTDKRRTSISIDEDVYRYLSQEQVNQSGLINELVREYRKNNNRQVAALELRLQHLQDERDALQERLDRKEEQIQDIQELLNETEDTESELFQDAVEVFTTMPEEEWNADNPAVTNWAGKLDMTEQQFIERLQQQCIN